MTFRLTRGSWYTVEVKFDWYNEVEYNPSNGKFMFFASSKPKSEYDHGFKEAKQLAELLKDFFEFDFYMEEGIEKVMFFPKKDCRISFK